jgi:hypothetical protein
MTPSVPQNPAVDEANLRDTRPIVNTKIEETQFFFKVYFSVTEVEAKK